jgi:hypothetical protein
MPLIRLRLPGCFADSDVPDIQRVVECFFMRSGSSFRVLVNMADTLKMEPNPLNHHQTWCADSALACPLS